MQKRVNDDDDDEIDDADGCEYDYDDDRCLLMGSDFEIFSIGFITSEHTFFSC